MNKNPRDYIKDICRSCGVRDGHDDDCLVGENESLRDALERVRTMADYNNDGITYDIADEALLRKFR